MLQRLALPGLEAAADEAKNLILQGTRRVALTGRASAGKSTALGLVGERLRDTGWRVLRSQMPIGDDAGLVALASLAGQLGQQVASEVKAIHVSWEKKLEAVSQALAGLSENTAVLLDDPWLASSDDVPSVFAERASEAVGALSAVQSISLVISTTQAPLLLGTRNIAVATAARADQVLSPEHWTGPFAEAAATVLANGGTRLGALSPVELRLCVAHMTAGTALNDVLALALGPRGLARALIDSFSERLRRTVARMAVMRTPFDDQTLAEFLGDTSEADAELVRRTLLFQTSTGWVMPELLVRESGGLGRVDRIEAHRVAARFHARHFADISNDENLLHVAMRHEMEEVHHLTLAEDAVALLDRSLYFVEQYDALGRTLGMRGVEEERPELLRLAVQAYERSLAHDPQDAYAHHYVAYNLDVLAEDAARVESEYREALRLRPDHVWHHGRLITFLVARGRHQEAQLAWDAALRDLDALRGYRWLYRELHRPLTRLLLHRGALSAAEAVLADIPSEMVAPWRRALDRLLMQLKEAELDHLVFPASVELANRWKGPHLVRSEAECKLVKQWVPGRIEEVGAAEVVLRVAEREGAYGRRRYRLAAFQRLCSDARPIIPPAGTFLEILSFDTKVDVIRCHPPAQGDPDLPAKPFPPPDRYLRGAARARG